MRHGSFCLLWAASSPLCEGPRGDFSSPKSSKTEGNVMSPSCWAAHHRQSSKLASTAGGLCLWEDAGGPGKGGLWWAHALSSSNSSKTCSWNDKCLNTEHRLSLGGYSLRWSTQTPFFGLRLENSFPGQHSSKSCPLPNPLYIINIRQKTWITPGEASLCGDNIPA